MTKNIILNNDPKTEFQLLDHGFKLIDGQRKRNTGFYPYDEMQSTRRARARQVARSSGRTPEPPSNRPRA